MFIPSSSFTKLMRGGIAGAIVACLLLLMAACGAKGPLYMPRKPVTQTKPATTPTPSSQTDRPSEKNKASEVNPANDKAKTLTTPP